MREQLSRLNSDATFDDTVGELLHQATGEAIEVMLFADIGPRQFNGFVGSDDLTR